MNEQRLSEIREMAEASTGPCTASIIGTRDFIVGPHGRTVFEEMDADMESLIFHIAAREVVIELCDAIQDLKDKLETAYLSAELRKAS